MPALGESVTEGTVTRWLKRVGDTVDADEPLLEVSTDKVDTEIPSPLAGTLLEIVVGEDQTAEVGAPLAVIGSAEAATSQPTPSAPAPAVPQPPVAQQPTPPTPAQPAPPAEAPVPPSPSTQRWQPQPTVAPPAPEQTDGEYAVGDHPYVTPLVRKLAAQHGVDLNTITGTGVGGRIRKQDVEAAVEAAKAAAEAAKAAEQAAKAAPQAAVTAPSAPSVQRAATSARP
jgi:2-oxoglutarate dehydrogenase E2 component (dihydrolipoamide succinyltransferase)